MTSRSNPVAVAAGVVLAAVVVYLLLTRRTWFGQHLLLPMHPASPPHPGTVPRMARGLRPPVR